MFDPRECLRFLVVRSVSRIVYSSTQRVFAALCMPSAGLRGQLPKKPTIQFFPAFAILHICAALDTHTDSVVNARRKEAHQMPSPRWLARLAIPVMAGAALVTSAGIATADPIDPSNGAYLAQLRSLGFTWPPDQGHDVAMIELAHHICFDRWFVGLTPERIAQDVHAVMGDQGLSFGDVTAMVNTAESTFCPNGG
jgi:hypothetical protein